MTQSFPCTNEWCTRKLHPFANMTDRRFFTICRVVSRSLNKLGGKRVGRLIWPSLCRVRMNETRKLHPFANMTDHRFFFVFFFYFNLWVLQNGNYLFFVFVSVQMTERPDTSAIIRFSLQPRILRWHVGHVCLFAYCAIVHSGNDCYGAM